MKVKYLNLNILHGGKYFDKVVGFLKQEDADIVCLQEVFNSKNKNLIRRFRTVQEFKKTFPEYNVFYSPEFLGKFGDHWLDTGNMIMSKHKLVAKKTIYLKGEYGKYLEFPHEKDFSTHPKNMQHAQIKVGTKVLNVFNLHGIWGLDGEDNPNRLQMADIIVKEVKNNKRLILSGDFNVRPNTKTIGKIEKHLVNVFKDELKTTFNIKRKTKDKKGYAKSVVDMVFISSDIKVVDHQCPQVDVSDHLPLVCVFDI